MQCKFVAYVIYTYILYSTVTLLMYFGIANTALIKLHV